MRVEENDGDTRPVSATIPINYHEGRFLVPRRSRIRFPFLLRRSEKPRLRRNSLNRAFSLRQADGEPSYMLLNIRSDRKRRVIADRNNRDDRDKC